MAWPWRSPPRGSWPISTLRAGRRREPPQSGQVLMLRYLPSSSRTVAESVSAPAALQVRDHAFEGVALDRAAALFVQIDEGDLFVARTVQHLLAHVLGQFLERRLDLEFIVRGQAGEQRVGEGVAAVPASDRAGGQAQLGEGDHALGVEESDLSDAVAAGAGAHRVVEAEQPRLQFRQAVAADRAGVAAGEDLFAAAVHVQRQRAALGQLQGGFETLGQALLARA